MAKVVGLQGQATGKIGSIVYAVNSGQQIARQYQPVVANPSTVAQVNSRAKLKLGSQLATALQDVIVIPKEGLKSKKNMFIKKNYENILAANGTAQIVYEDVQLTNGAVGIPQITATRTNEGAVSVELAHDASASVNRIVYIMYKKTEENQLQYMGSVIQDEAGADGKFAADLGTSTGELVLYAYGMKDQSAAATAKFGSMSVANGQDVAVLVATRKIKSSDYVFTKTRGATMGMSQNSIDAVPDGSARVFTNIAEGEGTVSGAGTFTIGSQVTVTAAAASGYHFDGWYTGANADNLSRVSSSLSYTFTLSGQTQLWAVFAEDNPNGDGADDH